jgi:hypothetical protein
MRVNFVPSTDVSGLGERPGPRTPGAVALTVGLADGGIDDSPGSGWAVTVGSGDVDFPGLADVSVGVTEGVIVGVTLAVGVAEDDGVGATGGDGWQPAAHIASASLLQFFPG